MSLLNDFARVSRHRPCPICQHRGWCLVSREGDAHPVSAICARSESTTRIGDAGWLHALRGDVRRARPRGVELEPIPVDHRREAERLALGADLEPVARSLGVPTASLRRLLVGVGDDQCGPFSSWPQLDEQLRVVGISLRRFDGSKRLRRGDRAGLHVPVDIPEDLSQQRVLIVEGGSDAAAGLALGRVAIGRPSVLAGFKALRLLLRPRRPAGITVVADRDEDGAGLRGAIQLARSLSVVCPDVRTIEPPPRIKDLRKWLEVGLDAGKLAEAEEGAK